MNWATVWSLQHFPLSSAPCRRTRRESLSNKDKQNSRESRRNKITKKTGTRTRAIHEQLYSKKAPKKQLGQKRARDADRHTRESSGTTDIDEQAFARYRHMLFLRPEPPKGSSMTSPTERVAPRQVGDRVGQPYAGCKPRTLSGLLALLMTWALRHWTAQQIEEAIYNRGVKVPLRESVVTEEDTPGADDILNAGEMEEAAKRRVAKTKSEARDQAQKHYRRESQRPTKNCSSCDGNNRIFRTPAHPRHLLPQPMHHRP